MAVTDPVDARLLAALAEQGRAAVHELAAKLGMDPREVAYRLVGLSGSGLPLLVGVECDPKGLRAALAGAWQASTAHPVQGGPSGVHPVQGTPSGPYRPHASGARGGPSAPTQGYAPAAPAVRADPVMSTWGPPQSSSWARGDQLPAAGAPAPSTVRRTGHIGDVLATEGLEGEQLTVQLLEVQDPADYLFGAAGYSLRPGERAVVVHTEITNTGRIPFVSLPDNYLELLADDGTPVGKAPVSLTSRPPHKIGVQPGETLGGHTVYVLPDVTRVVSVRWNRRPESDGCSLTWGIDD